MQKSNKKSPLRGDVKGSNKLIELYLVQLNSTINCNLLQSKGSYLHGDK